jgi:virulence-associated protein VagC
MSKKVIKQLEAPTPELINESAYVVGKVFMNGGSQAIRIPAAMRFDTDEVRISFDEESGTVLIRPMDKESMKASFIAQVKALTKEERDEIKSLALKRDTSMASINKDVALFFRDSE